MENNNVINNTEFSKTTKNNYYKVDPRSIVVVENFNSRIDFAIDELKESIKLNGVKNPISVIPFKEEDGTEKYRLVDGERRYRAVMSLLEEGVDIKRVPCLFLSKSLKPEELLMEQILRNEGKRFSEYEYAIAFRKFEDLGYSPKETIEKLGLQSWKVIYMKHLERDERVQKLMREGKIEGAEVRKIYQAHGKNDEQGAVKEILDAAEQLEQNGGTKKKVTLKSLNSLTSKTIAVKDTSVIKKGLETFYNYVVKIVGNDENFYIDPLEVYSILSDKSNKDTIVDIITNMYAEYQKENPFDEEQNMGDAEEVLEEDENIQEYKNAE